MFSATDCPYRFLQTKQKRKTAKRLSIESRDARQTTTAEFSVRIVGSSSASDWLIGSTGRGLATRGLNCQHINIIFYRQNRVILELCRPSH
jgi:hypothetical protein